METKEIFKMVFKPQKEIFKELVGELNGKVMDYETCRLLEDFFNEHTEILVVSFIDGIKKSMTPKRKIKEFYGKFSTWEQCAEVVAENSTNKTSLKDIRLIKSEFEKDFAKELE